MTSSPPPIDPATDDGPDPDVDAVLAVLDDTATPEQRRTVARDPDLRTHLAEQQAAIEALADPVPPLDPDVAARLRSRAIDDRDDAPADDPTGDGDTVPPAIPLAPRRPARRRPGWPAVAAVVMLLMGIGLALIVTDRPGEETAARDALTAGSADEAAEEAARDLGAEAAEGAGANASPTGPPGESADDATASGAGAEPLVRYPDQAALERDLRAVDPATLQPPGAGDADADDPVATRAAEQAELCDHGLRAVDPNLDPVQAARLVLVDDLEVLVVSHPVRASTDSSATTLLTALDARSCTPLFAVQR